MWFLLLLLALIVSWYIWKGNLKKKVAHRMDEVEARHLLQVGLAATRDEIIAAHRRIIATAHPDRGGNLDLAGRVNAARDLLLSRLSVNGSRAPG